MFEAKKLSFITKFFLFCSGSSLNLISKCPNFEIIKYSTIGFTIFLTSLLALFSSFFALSLIFNDLVIIIIGSIFWSAIIFNLDRYIVMTLRTADSFSGNLMISLPRFVIAFLVAIVISKPIEIKLFEKEINNFEIQNKINKSEDIENKLQSTISELDTRKKIISDEYEKKSLIVEKFYDDYMCECAGTCGTLIRGRGIECENRKSRWEAEVLSLNFESIKKDSLIDDLVQLEKISVSQAIIEKNIIEESSFGFFDKVKALSSINFLASNFILLIFIMVEIAPMLTKLLSRKGPYDSLIMKSEYEFETEFLKSTDFLKIMREKKEKIDKINSNLDIEQTTNFVKKISRHDAFDRYEKLRNSINEK